MVIIAEADYAVLLSYTIKQTYRMYTKASFFKGRLLKALFAGGTLVVLAFNPWKYVLQYCMSLVSLMPFIEDNGMHASTAACNTIRGAEHIDIIYAVFSTFVAYVLAPVIVYSVASVVHPSLPLMNQHGFL